MSLTEPTPGRTDDSGKYTDDQLSKLAKQSKDKDFEHKAVEWVKSAHSRCRTVRQQIERQWYINLAFYIGKQNVSVVGAGSSATGVRLYVPPAPYYRSRPVINRIRPIIRTELAKLTAQKPTATIVPATSEDRDLLAAQAGEQIWESIYRDKKVKSAFRRSMLWTLTCGTGFIKSFWDPNKFDKVSKTKGDFSYETVTPFHLFVPDLMSEDIEDQPYVIHIQTKSPEWIRLNYPGIKAEPNVVEANDILNDSFLNLVGAGDFRKNSVLCYEVWAKPGHIEFMPNGGMFTVIGSTVVQFVESNPYIHQQFPFTKFDHIPNGRFYSDSVISDLVPIQREYNRTRGQMIEAKNKMGHPQIMAAQGSVDASRITTEPGQVIEYKLGFPAPQPLPLQNIPSYVIQEVERLTMDFEDISGQHQVSKGQVPPGVTAATAISFLQEQDESMLSTSFDSIEEGFEKIGYQTLCYVKQYWDIPRMVKVTGADNHFNVMSFVGSQLGDNTDIRVEAGSALPTSKSAKQALLMDLMGQGFIPPEKGLELMDVGGVRKLYEEIQIDSAQASRENMRMSQVNDKVMEEYLQTFMAIDPETGQPQKDEMGQPMLTDPNTGGPLVDAEGNPTEPPLIVPVNSFDNHEVHIKVHNNYRKSQEYEQLDQPVKDLFEEHVNQHMMALGVPPGMPVGGGPSEGSGEEEMAGQTASEGSEVPMEGQQLAGPQTDAQRLPEGLPPGMEGMM